MVRDSAKDERQFDGEFPYLYGVGGESRLKHLRVHIAVETSRTNQKLGTVLRWGSRR